MAIGPGKYDDLCTEAREKSKARGAVLIILEGERGFGFSIQAAAPDLVRLPAVLRIMADNIEEDLRKGKNMISMKDAYPKEDVCRYCGEHLGWLLHPMAEMLALRLCDKPECQKKAKLERSKDVGR